jgi:FG-GAP-like repeat/FG-GAP repeat
VIVLLGRGDGTFLAARSYGPKGPSVAVADFNRDGKLDLAVTTDSSVNILLGNGDGTFQTSPTYAAGYYPSSAVVGDWNGDGLLDLVVVNGNPFGAGTVTILLGKGDGTFQPGPTIPAGLGPNSVAAGDFNGDGKLDLVTTNFAALVDHGRSQILERDVLVFLGNGDGTFQAPQRYTLLPGGLRPSFVAVGDFNGDGIADLVVVSLDTGIVSLLLGNGDGTFQAPRNHSAGTGSRSVVVADFNADGYLDIALATGGPDPNPGRVSILLGNGDGSFQSVRDFTVGSQPSYLAVGDFNRDGVPDLAVTDELGVSILLGKGDGTFQAAQSYAAGPGGQVMAGDFNGDGLPDLAFAADVTVLLNAADWAGGP